MRKNAITIEKRPFWTMPSSEVVSVLGTHSENGLSNEEVKRRLEIFGPNIIEKSHRSSAFFIFLNQLKSPLILILLFAGAVTFSVGHGSDSLFIFITVIVNSLLGFFQEFKAERALAELKTYLKQRSRVIRDGVEQEIDAANLVPGDIIRLAQGNRVPADGRILFVNDFQIDEALLTGESLPVSKSVESVAMDSSLGDQRSMVFAGTLVTQGVATAVVCRTDFSTELGKIAALVAKSEKEETPLQVAITKFSLRAGIFLVIFTLLIFIIGIAFGHSWIEMFLTSVAIAVSAVPEGLPVAMTVILAIGVERMAKRKGVIRKLVAAEALGSTSVILTDKTGTLTMAKMELGKLLPSGIEEGKLLELAMLNTDVLVENSMDPVSEWRMNGRVIEVSLVRSAALRNVRVEAIKSKVSIINFLPFNAVNKFSVSLIREQEKHTLVFFGAPDIFIEHSTLPPAERQETLRRISSLALSGELVVGVATKEIFPKKDFSFSKDLELDGLTFKGLITLRDPVRPSVKDAIKRVESYGIKIVVMTGDHRGTAFAIAREVGLAVDDVGSVLDVAELRTLSDVALKKQLKYTRVISRVTPLDKMRVVKAYQEMGEVVAMTGDGVNDAPSIKQADIGIAMGSGTEVARDVADLVLLDDNFETIAAAVEEGRQIMNNIRKVLVYLLSSVADELILIGSALIIGLPLPFNALQILWVNFFSDSFPAVAFAFEKGIDGKESRPQSVKAGLFDPLMKFLILYIGLSTSAFLFVLYWVLLRLGFPTDIVRTFIFASFGSYSLFMTFSVRSFEKSIFEYPMFSNRFLLLGVGIGVVLMGSAIYLPFLQTLFGTVSLPPVWLLGVVLVGVMNITAIEFGKWLFRRKSVIRV